MPDSLPEPEPTIHRLDSITPTSSDLAKLGERIIGDAYDALGVDDDDVRALRALLIVSYAQTGRIDDAQALHVRFPLPDEDE